MKENIYSPFYQASGQTITKFFLILTKACNLRCVYCHQGQEKCAYEKSEWVDPEKVAKYFPAEGEYIVSLFGGEPLLNWDYFLDIVYELKNRNPNIRLSTVTNGTLLTVKKAKILNSLDICVGVSHDGYKFEQTRRTKDFLKINPEPYLTLNKRGLAATSCSINPDFYGDIWEYFDEFLIKHGLPKKEHVFIQIIKDVEGNTADNLFIYNDPKWEAMLDKVFKNLESQIKGNNFDTYEWLQYRPLVTKLNDFFSNDRVCCHCGADTNVAHMDLKGNLYPCHNMSLESSNGHVNKGLQPGKHNPYISTPSCSSCEILPICGGGCIANHPDKHKYLCYTWYQQGKRFLDMLRRLKQEGGLENVNCQASV